MIQRCRLGLLTMNRCSLHRRTRWRLAIRFIDLEFAGYLVRSPAKLSDALTHAPCNLRKALCTKNEKGHQKDQQQFGHANVSHHRSS